MKKFILLLALLPTMLLAQDSWVQFKVQYDSWAPQESNWFMVEDTVNGDTAIFHQPTIAYQYLDTTISINSGNYVITLNDSYGDGWNSNNPAWFKMQNDCQGQILNYDPLWMMFFQLDTLVNIQPCAPPLSGCTDSIATNYDNTATTDDGSCIYPPCNGLDTFYVETYCTGATATVKYNWSNMPNPNCRMASYTRSTDLYNLGSQWYPYPSNWSNTALIYQNQQPNMTYYFVGMLTDSTYTDTLVITTPDCIPGCTDPTALNYNPWANSDDSSCQAPPANCAAGESNIVVTIMTDTYFGETSWELADTTGNILAVSSLYSGEGETVITEVCVPNGTVVEFTLMDNFGDGLCGSCYGGVDGSALVQTLCGDTILSIQSPNANFGTDTSVLYTVAPCTVNAILGCTTPGFTEYNPQATQDDSTCLTPVVLGCIDPTSPDYNSSANTMDIIPTCDYTLVITDAAQDGWFGAWLGVLQDTTTFGPFMMGPYDGGQQTFTISLSALSPVDIMFFAPGNSSSTADQNGFYLIGPEGDTTLSGGTNAWLDPIKKFPFKYNNVPECGDYCTDGIIGCMDALAFNYDPLANMPSTCIPIVLGCTNDLAFNYDPTANVDDGGCIAEVIGCMDTTAFNFNPSANSNDQSSCIPVINGCMDITQFNYNAAANTDDGNCIPFVYGCTDTSAFNYDITANTSVGCIPVIEGCIDPLAFNYDVNANTDNGTCIAEVLGCTDPTALNYDSLANINIGCIYPVLGCTDATQFNYDPLANTDNGSCVPFIYGCMDNTMWNYNQNANTDNNSCIPFVYGCTDSTSFNYDPLANTDNNSCVGYVYGCTNPVALNYNLLANTDDGSCINPIYGCTDSTQFNYNPLANTDNNTCVPFIYGCTNPNALNYNANANTDDGTCINPIYGCMDSIMFNYNALANVDNGNCIPFIYGCNDVSALNYNPLANTSDNTCCYISGCMDATALNYDPNACYEPVNTCITAVSGCTDVAAYNYNPAANVSDTLACLYDAGCYGGPGIPYWLNDGCYAWVIDVDDFCCTNDWDASCQSMYDYCQLGWPTSIEDISALGIVVYPNPTKDIVTIETRLEIEVELYDMIGSKVVSERNTKRLDLSKLPNGIYNMVILYNSSRYSKKVIKQ